MRACLVWFLVLAFALPAVAADRTAGPPPRYLDRLACRIAVRTPGPAPVIQALADARLNTLSDRPSDRTFRVRLFNGQQLSAMVQHVYVTLPRDRFNVTLLLDGKPYLRLNHMDLDIFAETTVDDQPYLLHCFRDIDLDQIESKSNR